MDFGLAYYQPDDAPLARLLGATWATTSMFVSEPVGSRSEWFAALTAEGLRPVVDYRTTPSEMSEMLYAADREPMENRRVALRWYTDGILRHLDANPEVRDAEIWADAEVARFSSQDGPLLAYGFILTETYARLHAERPDVRVWTGGAGACCRPDFIQYGLAPFSPDAFDVCNWHPFVESCGDWRMDAECYHRRLTNARTMVDEGCRGQPFAASAFGIPTLPVEPDPRYGRDVLLPGGVRAIHYRNGLQHYAAILSVLKLHGFEVVCILARDQANPDTYHDYGGLCKTDGTLKPFVAPLAERLAGGTSAQTVTPN